MTNWMISRWHCFHRPWLFWNDWSSMSNISADCHVIFSVNIPISSNWRLSLKIPILTERSRRPMKSSISTSVRRSNPLSSRSTRRTVRTFSGTHPIQSSSMFDEHLARISSLSNAYTIRQMNSPIISYWTAFYPTYIRWPSNDWKSLAFLITSSSLLHIPLQHGNTRWPICHRWTNGKWQRESTIEKIFH